MVGRAHEASDRLMQLMQGLVSRIYQIEAQQQQQHQAPQLQGQYYQAEYGVDGGEGPAPGIGPVGLIPYSQRSHLFQQEGVRMLLGQSSESKIDLIKLGSTSVPFRSDLLPIRAVRSS